MTRVESSLTSRLSIRPAKPLGAMFSCDSMEYLTMSAVRAVPSVNLTPGVTFRVNSV